MDKFTLDAETVGSLTQLVADPTASGNLGFLAGVLLVLMVIIAVFAITTFVLGIVATVKAAKAGRACGFATPMAKASIPFGIIGIVAPVVMWRLSDTMCATGLLIAGFVCSIIAISSASNRLKAKATAEQAASVAVAHETRPSADEPAAQEVPAAPADDEVVSGSADEVVADADDACDEAVGGEVPFSEQATDAFRVISPDEPTVRPVDPIEPAIEEGSLSSVGDGQADAPADEARGDMTEGEPEEAASDADESVDEAEEEEEPIEPMHKMTTEERRAQVAEREVRRAEARALAAERHARAMRLAAEDPDYAEYLAGQGKIAGGLKKD